MNEDAADPEAGDAVLAEQVARRAYWEQLSDGLLLAWLCDFDDAPAVNGRTPRESLIAALVSLEVPTPEPRGRVPASGKPSKGGLKAVQAVWIKRNVSMCGPPPGLQADGGPLCVSSSDEDVDAEASAACTQRRLSPFATPARSPTAAAACTPASPAAPGPGTPGRGAARAKRCLTCVSPRPRDEVDDEAWRCLVCGLRGDLPAHAPENKFLSATLAAAPDASPRRAPSKSGAADAGAGEADESESDVRTRIDKEMIAAARAAPPFPLFQGPGAGGALTPGQALELARQSRDGQAMAHPSEALVEYIRSGKLRAVSLAVPMALEKAQRQNAEGDTIALTISGSGFKAMSKGLANAPPVASLQQFCLALFGSIIPALIDRPAALMSWVALARTAVEIHAKHGNWAPAEAYVSRLLNERIQKRAAFAGVEDGILSGIARDYPPGARPAAPAAGGGGLPDVRRAAPCRQFNWKTCSHGDTCSFAHVCAYSPACDAIAAGPHPARDCPAKPPRPAAPGNGAGAPQGPNAKGGK